MELIHLKSETRLIKNFAKNFAWILRIWKILGRQIFTDLKNKKKNIFAKIYILRYILCICVAKIPLQIVFLEKICTYKVGKYFPYTSGFLDSFYL